MSEERNDWHGSVESGVIGAHPKSRVLALTQSHFYPFHYTVISDQSPIQYER